MSLQLTDSLGRFSLIKTLNQTHISKTTVVQSPQEDVEVVLGGYVRTHCMCVSCFITCVVFFSLKTVVAREMWPQGWLIGNMPRFLFLLVCFVFYNWLSRKKKFFFVVLANFYDVNILTTANLIYQLDATEG